MKQFRNRFFLFLIIQASIAAVVWSNYRVDKTHYFAATIDKHNRLQQSPAPRLIIVGGSSVAFGIVSEILDDELPYAPVNMGIHAGFGLDFMLREILPDIEEGDVIVLAFEYAHYSAEQFSDYLIELIEQRPENINYLTFSQIPKIFDNLHPFLGTITRGGVRKLLGQKNNPIPSEYSRNAFNEYGDISFHRNRKSTHYNSYKNFPTWKYNKKENFKVIKKLNSFASFCGKRGAKVFLVYPPIEMTMYNKQSVYINKINNALNQYLTFPVIGNPEELVFSREFHWDSFNHLNGKGAERRTKIMVRDLKKALNLPE